MATCPRCSQVTNWSGTCYIFPLLGAFIADSYLGRYRTIIIFSIIYIIVSHFPFSRTGISSHAVSEFLILS